MRLDRRTAMFSLLMASSLAAGGAHAGEWVSYRDAYRAMVVFEKYGGAKNLIQNHLQVLPREADPAGQPLELTLSGKATQFKLPLDPTGRAVFPLLKAAYDDNAVLALNRKGVSFTVRPQVSIALRADGVYDAAELRTACEQALGYIRYVDASARARQCTGVRFVFEKKAGTPSTRLRKADGSAMAMPVTEGGAFGGEPDAGFPTVTYRFAGAERAQVLTATAPLAIAPLFD